MLGHHYALNQRFPAALDAFNRADAKARLALEPGRTRSLTATLSYIA